MVDPPSSKPFLYLIGGKVSGSISGNRLWNPPANAIFTESPDDVGRGVTTEVKNADPVRVAVDNN